MFAVTVAGPFILISRSTLGLVTSITSKWATATPPPRIGQLEGRGALWTLNAVAAMVPYNGVWNMTGQPAAAVPAGLGSDGLPRAVQVIGRANGEAQILSLAAQLEGARPWAQRRPADFV